MRMTKNGSDTMSDSICESLSLTGVSCAFKYRPPIMTGMLFHRYVPDSACNIKGVPCSLRPKMRNCKIRYSMS